ncbi:hypothetical protein [Enterococcus faecium]|uniref:hypothetical protein n=1 Tax=Enterococcus faecium TaxID=1352 RepID=UPI003F522230
MTAEGVEQKEQLEYLRDQGVDLIQGYLLGRPAPWAELKLVSGWPDQLRATCA